MHFLQGESRMKKSNIRVAALAMALALAGCSSVPLNDVPVENKGATPNAGSTTPPPATRVEPVTTGSDATQNQGPQNVARLIYFDFDSYVIKPEYQSIVDGHARYLKANPARHIFIEGHTDERGGREYNLALGQRRAEAVRNALRLLGVQDNQVEAVSFGKEKPAVQGSGEEAWAKNRRAEIVYR
jgi:peptidoglycan-associated lipoprotein